MRTQRPFPSEIVGHWRGCATGALALLTLHCGVRGGPGEVARAAGSATAAATATASASQSAAAVEVADEAETMAPACAEGFAEVGPWARAEAGDAGLVRVVAGAAEKKLGGLTQGIAGRGATRLRFLGSHTFDALDKLDAEGGGTEGGQRKMACAMLNAAALRGAAVVRIWGSLKRTGMDGEIERARAMLALLLSENARRQRPLRFVVSLLNHQPGYGLPDPTASLDEQKAPGWSAREVYLEGAWQRRGVGQLAERIERYSDDEAIRRSPYVLAWELVNELDTHRSVAHGAFVGEASKLRTSFLLPAARLLSERFPQPIALGDLRGVLLGYRSYMGDLIEELAPEARARLLWTSHVYVERASAAPSASEEREAAAKATRKLDLDLEVARAYGLPFLLGEIGQLVRGATTTYCKGGARHDVAGLLQAVLVPEPDPRGRREIEAALFWGEGACGLTVDAASGWRVNVGAGGDTADLGPDEAAAHGALRDARRWPRFVLP